MDLTGHNSPPTDWGPANNGGGKRKWFVFRYVSGRMEIASDRRGYYRRFASFEAAKRVATQLN